MDEALGITNLQIQTRRESRPKSIIKDNKDIKEKIVLQYREL